jgi:hypothetical protein
MGGSLIQLPIRGARAGMGTLEFNLIFFQEMPNDDPEGPGLSLELGLSPNLLSCYEML